MFRIQKIVTEMLGLSLPHKMNIPTQIPGPKLHLRRVHDIDHRSMIFSSKACFLSNDEADLSVVPEIFKRRIVK